MPGAAALRPFASASLLAHVRQTGGRAFSTASSHSSLIAPRARAASRPALSTPTLRQTFRRNYNDNINPETKAAVKKGGFKFFKWAWRITYLSTIAGVGWVAYGIYEMRHPTDQPDPDPSKKTLVILGKFCSLDGTQRTSN